ncbi:MAG: tyrosine-type recombinase/integrase, partial [Pseudomonadota bacterium]
MVKLGWQHVGSDGWLTFKQTKTGGEVAVPLLVLPDACTELLADHEHVTSALRGTENRMLFLETKSGAPRSEKALSAWFGRACTDAGLPAACGLHGLRKARAVALRELGWDVG